MAITIDRAPGQAALVASTGSVRFSLVASAPIDPASLDQLLHPTIDPHAERTVMASGLPASPGAATGEIVLDSDEAEAAKAAGKKVILVEPLNLYGCRIGDNTFIGPFVEIQKDVVVGNNCRIQSLTTFV